MPWTKLQVEREEPNFDESEGQNVRKLTFGEALREALDQALERDPRVYAMGQGIDDPGGMFGSLGFRGCRVSEGQKCYCDCPPIWWSPTEF